MSAFLPPIQPGEIYARCPRCHMIGWTTERAAATDQEGTDE